MSSHIFPGLNGNYIAGELIVNLLEARRFWTPAGMPYTSQDLCLGCGMHSVIHVQADWLLFATAVLLHLAEKSMVEMPPELHIPAPIATSLFGLASDLWAERCFTRCTRPSAPAFMSTYFADSSQGASPSYNSLVTSFFIPDWPWNIQAEEIPEA